MSIKNKKKFEQTLKEYKDYAEQNGFHLNPNQEIVHHLINALLEQEKKHGKRYCPCRLINEKESNDTVCPCIYHKEEIKKNGHCHCMLFVK